MQCTWRYGPWRLVQEHVEGSACWWVGSLTVFCCRELRMKYGAESEVSELSERLRESLGTSQASRHLHSRSSLGLAAHGTSQLP